MSDGATEIPPGFSLETVIDENGSSRLVLRDLADLKKLPLDVDFLSGQLLHRLKHGLGKDQPLPRALGIKSIKSQGPYVIDVTAGLGTDAFIMAAMGCRVRGIERSPIVAQLLEDGLRRLREAVATDPDHSDLAPIASRLSFELGSASDVLQGLSESERPDVVFLDPMFPEEGHSSALPKKGMQLFRRLIGDDADADDVFRAALGVAKQRAVVKRPIQAPHLGGKKPTHSFAGKTARFDMYLIKD